MKEKYPVIQLNRKTAFFAALYLNIFFVFVQLVILTYSFYMGENVGEIITQKLTGLIYSVEPLVLILVNTFLLYLFFRIEFWILLRFPDNRKKVWSSFFLLLLFVAIISTLFSQVIGIWFKDELTVYQYSIIQFVKDLMLFISSVAVTYLIYLL